MRTVWQDGEQPKQVSAPVSLIVTAFAPVSDARRVVTPELRSDVDSILILIDLGGGRQRLGGSALAQVTQQIGNESPDLDDPALLAKFFEAIQQLNAAKLLLAYHDISDGGLFTTACEMAFAGRCGVALNIDLLAIDPHAADWGDFKIRPEQVSVQRNERTLQALFSEELGALIQVPAAKRDAAMAVLREHGLARCSNVVGKPDRRDLIEIYRDAKCVYSAPRAELQTIWSETSHRIASLRDNPECADEEFASIKREADPGLQVHAGFDVAQDIAAPFIASGIRPRVAILREQGVNKIGRAHV